MWYILVFWSIGIYYNTRPANSSLARGCIEDALEVPGLKHMVLEILDDSVVTNRELHRLEYEIDKYEYAKLSREFE